MDNEFHHRAARRYMEDYWDYDDVYHNWQLKLEQMERNAHYNSYIHKIRNIYHAYNRTEDEKIKDLDEKIKDFDEKIKDLYYDLLNYKLINEKKIKYLQAWPIPPFYWYWHSWSTAFAAIKSKKDTKALMESCKEYDDYLSKTISDIEKKMPYVKFIGMTDTELYRAIDEKKNLCNSCEHKKDKKAKANKGIIIAIIIFAVLLLGVGIWLLVAQSLVVEGVSVIIAGILSLLLIIAANSTATTKKKELQIEEKKYAQEKQELENELKRRKTLKAQNMMSNKDDIEVKTQQRFWPKSIDLENPQVKYDLYNLIKELNNKEKEEGQN